MEGDPQRAEMFCPVIPDHTCILSTELSLDPYDLRFCVSVSSRPKAPQSGGARRNEETVL